MTEEELAWSQDSLNFCSSRGSHWVSTNPVAILVGLLLLVVFCCVCVRWPNICISSPYQHCVLKHWGSWLYNLSIHVGSSKVVNMELGWLFFFFFILRMEATVLLTPHIETEAKSFQDPHFNNTHKWGLHILKLGMSVFQRALSLGCLLHLPRLISSECLWVRSRLREFVKLPRMFQCAVSEPATYPSRIWRV